MASTVKFSSGQTVDILPGPDGANYLDPEGWLVVGPTRHPYLMKVREPVYGTTVCINVNRLRAHGVQVLHDIDRCDVGSDVTCPDCVCCGIIQTTECDTCGACRWVHRHDGTIYNPTTGLAVR